jgi:hypothetical protein
MKEEFWFTTPNVLYKSICNYNPKNIIEFMNLLTILLIIILIIGLSIQNLYVILILLFLIIFIIIINYLNIEKLINIDPQNKKINIITKNKCIAKYNIKKKIYLDKKNMNPVMSFNNSNVIAACNADDKDIKAIATNFNKDDLFKNTEELFDKKNIERVFYTIPVTNIPPDTVEFAKYLNDMSPSCKENSINCLKD